MQIYMQWLNLSRNCGGAWLRKSARLTCNKTRLVLLIAILSAFSFLLSCRMELNIRIYIRSWLSPPEDILIEPLSSCFDKVSNSSVYYQGSSKFRPDLVPGLPVWESHTCYDFASLLKPNTSDSYELYHTYWSSNMTGFDEKQLATLRSFSATQKNVNHTLIVWIPAMDESALIKSSAWTHLKRQQQKEEGKRRSRIIYRVIDPTLLVHDTPLETFTDKWRQLVSEDRQGKDDLLRMLVLYQFGGIWFDLNTLFVRDLSPLRGHEWMAQGNCASGTLGNPFTGALFHFNRNSPYVCEMLEGAADVFKADRKEKQRYLIKGGSDIFGSKLYHRIYRRITHHGIRPWSGLPWCFTDPSQCNLSNSLPSLFSNSDFDEKRVNQIFAYHWREKWTATPGKLFKFIDNANHKRTNW
ncbi:hypothetical protein K501DRAFT_331902 [Backusella circina FSU 941]|nr:hypothetical protein K501DRAFT_331902 [Backusella circina FSU 941]